jgi:hypothetical protein
LIGEFGIRKVLFDDVVEPRLIAEPGVARLLFTELLVTGPKIEDPAGVEG